MSEERLYTFTAYPTLIIVNYLSEFYLKIRIPNVGERGKVCGRNVPQIFKNLVTPQNSKLRICDVKQVPYY